MFVGIANTPRDYAWGSRTAIADFLGTEPSGAPEAELWLGTHPGSPSRLVGAAGDLRDVVPEGLPFLLKVLAADAPLSVQAHPTLEQARAGFERENAAGIPLDAPHRNYKDPLHKPELILAVSGSFDALCGFRPAAESRASIERLGDDERIVPLLDRLVDDDSLRAVFEWLISRGDGVDGVISAVTELAPAVGGLEFDTAVSLAEAYPGDPGVVISLLLHRVRLSKGEALYLPAGNIHAYLSGLGIELMAASDNVLRGGLTPKHVDVPELLSVLDFSPLPVPYLEPEATSPGVRVFRPDVPDFLLVEAEVAAGRDVQHALAGPAIVLCASGEVEIAGGIGHTMIRRGEACFASADELVLSMRGEGLVYLATTGG